MRILDRYVVRNFLLNYVLALVVLVGMYTVLDLVVNFDQFADANGPAKIAGFAGFVQLFKDIFDYYSYQLLVIFQQVSGVIPLLAAGFTMVRMTRHHELTAMLASGVSLYRVSVPVILCSVGFSLVVVVDQEVLMPRFADKLLRRHDEVNREAVRRHLITFVKDKDGSLILAASYDERKQEMSDVKIIQRKDGAPVGRVLANSAVWMLNPPGDDTGQPGWYMLNARQIDDKAEREPSNKDVETVGALVYHTGLTPRQLQLIFEKKAVDFLSTSQINELIKNSPESTKPELEKMMHIRFTQPLMNLVLLLIGIPFLLTREAGVLMRNIIWCTAVTGICFVTTFVLFQMAGTVLIPVLGAWLPVLIFTPVAAGMLDSIKT